MHKHSIKLFITISLILLFANILFDYVAFTFYWDYSKKEVTSNLFSTASKYSRLSLLSLWLITITTTKYWLKPTINKSLIIYVLMVLSGSIAANNLINIPLYSCIYYTSGFLFFYQATRLSLIEAKNIVIFSRACILLLFTIIIYDTINIRDVSNYGYFILSFLPMLFIYPKYSSKYFIFIVFVVVGVFISLKRGAIIACVISLFYALLYFRYFLPTKNSRTVLALLSTITAIYVGIEVAGEGLTERFQDIHGEKAGSSRLLIWNLLLTNWAKSDFFTKLIGFGADSAKNYLSIVYAPIYSHSDWLEALYNYGVLGLAVFLFFVYQFFTKWRKLHNSKNFYAICLGVSFIIFILKAIYSGNMMHNVFIYQLVPIAIVLGLQTRDEQNYVKV